MDDIRSIYAIEWNDAVFGALHVMPRGIAEIVFPQMCFYFYTSPTREFVTKSEYKAAVILSGITSLEIAQEVGDRDLVSDGTITDRHGQKVRLRNALEVLPIREISISFLSGCTIQSRCSSMQLEVNLAANPIIIDPLPRRISMPDGK
jgi:hypothetical protein